MEVNGTFPPTETSALLLIAKKLDDIAQGIAMLNEK
jgi:hypothetical protein